MAANHLFWVVDLAQATSVEAKEWVPDLAAKEWAVVLTSVVATEWLARLASGAAKHQAAAKEWVVVVHQRWALHRCRTPDAEFT